MESKNYEKESYNQKTLKEYFLKARDIFDGGLYVVFEGADNSGKDTQINLFVKELERYFNFSSDSERTEGFSSQFLSQLKSYLGKDNDLKIIKTMEPGSTERGKVIRELLLSKDYGPLNPLAELDLFMADRRIHFDEVVLPNLQKGNVIVSSRSEFSSWVYQGYVRGLNDVFEFLTPDNFEDYVSYRNYIATFVDNETYGKIGVLPDICFYLDINASKAMKRAKSLDRIENEGLEFEDKVREGYHKLAERYSGIFEFIDAGKSVNEVHENIMNHFRSHIKTFSKNKL